MVLFNGQFIGKLQAFVGIYKQINTYKNRCTHIWKRNVRINGKSWPCYLTCSNLLVYRCLSTWPVNEKMESQLLFQYLHETNDILSKEEHMKSGNFLRLRTSNSFLSLSRNFYFFNVLFSIMLGWTYSILYISKISSFAINNTSGSIHNL